MSLIRLIKHSVNGFAAIPNLAFWCELFMIVDYRILSFFFIYSLCKLKIIDSRSFGLFLMRRILWQLGHCLSFSEFYNLRLFFHRYLLLLFFQLIWLLLLLLLLQLLLLTSFLKNQPQKFLTNNNIPQSFPNLLNLPLQLSFQTIE